MACGRRNVVLDEKTINKINEFAFHMRKHALTMSYASGNHAVHFGGGMSVIDILAVLYAEILKLKNNIDEQKNKKNIIFSFDLYSFQKYIFYKVKILSMRLTAPESQGIYCSPENTPTGLHPHP